MRNRFQIGTTVDGRCHQRGMGLEKTPLIGHRFRKKRRGDGPGITGERLVAKHVHQLITQALADTFDDRLRLPAVFTGVTAVFDQRDRRFRRPLAVIAIGIDRRCLYCGRFFHVRHYCHSRCR